MYVDFIIRASQCVQSIETCLTSVFCQSFQPEQIYCVVDDPTSTDNDDGTTDVAAALALLYRHTGINFRIFQTGSVLTVRDGHVCWCMDGRDYLGYQDAVRDVVVFMEAWGSDIVYGPFLYVLRSNIRKGKDRSATKFRRVHSPQKTVVSFCQVVDRGTRLTRPWNWWTTTHLV